MKEMIHITDAEWTVMKCIWSMDNVTSTAIVELLRQDKNWEPTTVKTLLARLVKKEAIAYKKVGRTYQYYPLVSERTCIDNEMKLVVKKVYCSQLIQSSEHFEFYGFEDQPFNHRLNNALEDNYPRLCHDLGYKHPEKVKIYIHQTLQGMHSAMGVINGPSWFRGGVAWDIIHFAPADTFVEIEADEVILHVLVQWMLTKVNTELPYWLLQAVAVYEAQWLSMNRVMKVIREQIIHIQPNHLIDISVNYETFKAKDGYEWAYTLAEYIVSLCPQPSFINIINDPAAFQKNFGLDEKEFWLGWINYVKKMIL